MEIIIILFLTIISLFVYWIRRQFSYWQRRNIPHDKPNYIYGNAKGWRTTKQFKDIFDPIYKKYKGQGSFAGYYFYFRPVVLATDVEFLKDVLIKDFNNFQNRGVFNNPKDDPISGHLFAIDGEKWRTLRQKLSPTFTSGKMKLMFPTVLKIGHEFIQVFDRKIIESGDGNLEIIDLIKRFTADVIGVCAFGIECNSLINPNAEFVIMGRKATVERRHNSFIDGMMETFPNAAQKLRLRKFTDEVHNFYMNIVKDTVEYREKNNIKRNDFMNMLIELKNGEGGLTINEIAAQSFIFFLGGYDTSSTTMGFALYELAKNPDIQEKLRQHINEIFVKHKNQFTYECFRDMKYLEQVISETLRKYPVLPVISRLSKGYYQCSNPKFYLEPNTLVMIPAYSIHYDPEYYPDPERFDPERFSDEEIRKRQSCTWLPFGDGPRNCIGLRFGKMQTSIGLALLLRNFKFSCSSKTQKEINFVIENILLEAVGGINLHIEKI